MAELKIFRTIDRRNCLYGRYKYQINLNRMKATTWEVTSWCNKQWGSARIWKEVDNGHGGLSCWSESNPAWTTRRKGRQTPKIYLKGDKEATLFGLMWTGK